MFRCPTTGPSSARGLTWDSSPSRLTVTCSSSLIVCRSTRLGWFRAAVSRVQGSAAATATAKPVASPRRCKKTRRCMASSMASAPAGSHRPSSSAMVS
jgi:hypothetical protein